MPTSHLTPHSSQLATAVDELVHRHGRMAQLGSEDGELKLDWVDAVGRLLADGSGLETVEEQARHLWQRGIRHIIWSGMGGSVVAVQTMLARGICDGSETGSFVIHPLDSTDPAALNHLVERLARDKGLPAPVEAGSSEHYLNALLDDVLMVGVAMGMTSEEPITHLEWFAGLLGEAGLPAADHMLVMTLPGSYLDRFARRHEVPSLPLQLDGGNGTGGRMSAPSTRVFLLPAALYLTRCAGAPSLRQVLSEAWGTYDLPLAASRPAEHPSVRTALQLNAAARDGACRLLLAGPGPEQAILPWVEQLMEESLGKGGKGIVVVDDQPVPASPAAHPDDLLRLPIGSGVDALHADGPQTLTALATASLRWQLVMALYGYLNDIHFAGQPAVENYKTRARRLREETNPLDSALQSTYAVTSGALALLTPNAGDDDRDPAAVLAADLLQPADGLGYLDLTYNGEPPAGWEAVAGRMRDIGNRLLGVPVKVRRAPAAYHSTEQSEMDGPPYLVSLRVLARRHERCAVGAYDDRFLIAQALATWQAMTEAGRRCYLLVVDGDADATEEETLRFLAGVTARLEVP